ncbi:MAG TPA: hypothetical protein VF668_15185 [Pyrinomonadaceae bacterium]
MRNANLEQTAGGRARRLTFICLLILASCAPASAQTGGAPRQTTPPAEATSGATADEDFELNIDLRRISERDFQAGTAVEAGGESGLRLKVGATLRASDIEVLLQGVRGRVRFRASLAPLLRLLDARRAAPAAEASPPAAPAP